MSDYPDRKPPMPLWQPPARCAVCGYDVLSGEAAFTTKMGTIIHDRCFHSGGKHEA